ncbi:nuclear transport factor 2 family protein [Streptomyces sp. JNUCC 64]
MTQRVDLATVMDRLALDALLSAYAHALDEGDRVDPVAFRELFVPGGRPGHPLLGGPPAPGPVPDAADRLADALGPFPVRQHLLVNRLVRFDVLERDDGDLARVRADCLSVLRSSPDGPGRESGARYDFTAVRTPDGWLLRDVVTRELWRRERA